MRRSIDLAWVTVVLFWLMLAILYWGFSAVMFAIAATIGFWVLLQSFFWVLAFLIVRHMQLRAVRA